MSVPGLKICAFGVRDDELETLKSTGRELELDLVICQKEPTMESAGEAEGCVGVTISGQSIINAELLEAYKKMGVRYLTT